MWNTTDGPQDYAKVVGANVRRLREREGWTLKQLESVLTERGYPIGFRVLSKIETGGATVRVNDLVALASALDVNVDRLLLPPEVVLKDRFVELAKFAGRAHDEHIASLRKWVEATDEVVRAIDELAAEEPDAADKFVQYLHEMYPDQFGVADAIEKTIGSRRNPRIITKEDAQWWSVRQQCEVDLFQFLEDRYGERPDDAEKDAGKLRAWVNRVIEGESNRG